MIEKKLEKLADVLMENETNPNIDKEIIVYGLTSALEHLASIITIIILGLLFGLPLQSIVFFISFSLIRTYAGGYHCQKTINCYLMSNGIVVVVLAIVKFLPREYMLIIGTILLIISIPILLKIAPVESANKPLDEVEQKYYRKKTIIYLVAECIIIAILFIFSINDFAFIMNLSIAIIAILVLLQNYINKKNLCK